MVSTRELLEKTRTELNKFFDQVDTEALDKIVDVMNASKGMIIFTGVGKSGMIAGKIAVTMTSTGTRALFLSPTDSMHGDMGFVGKGDIVFLLSKSGESDELLTLVPYLRNKGAILVALVTEAKSRLAKATDYVIELPFETELCPFNLAPTLSTTEQLIIGDILSIALMMKKKVTVEEFAANHPAGRIGKRITMKVRDLMIKDPLVPLAKPNDKLIDILVELSNKRAGCVLIIDEERKLQGIFTDGDLRRALQKYGSSVLQLTMNELMTKTAKKIGPDVLALEAMRFMEENQKFPIMVLPVVEEDMKVVGLIKLHDIIQSGV